jgi:hypothetical protein
MLGAAVKAILFAIFVELETELGCNHHLRTQGCGGFTH